MKEVYIAGEDPVTCEIIYRVLRYCSPDFHVLQKLPARGSEIKNKIEEFNTLAASAPVVLLVDSDTDDCAPCTKRNLLDGLAQHPNFLINISVDEAEAWLMADRVNFADYIGVPVADVPQASLQKQGGMKPLIEVACPVKSSYYLTHDLALHSSKEDIRQSVAATGRSCKGKAYNSAMIPFIKDRWDIDNACKNSDSLSRMIARIKNLSHSC